MLIHSIIEVHSKSLEGFEGKCTLETKEILIALRNLIDHSEYGLNPNLTRQALKIMRKLIEIENGDMTTPAAEWDTDDWFKFKDKIFQKQELLVEEGIIPLICRIIQRNDQINDDIFEEAILVAISLILGGNEIGQNRFLEFMQEDLDNKFLNSIKDRLLEKFQKVKERENETRKKKIDYQKFEQEDHAVMKKFNDLV